MADETESDSRAQKLESRERARRHGKGGRSYLHAVTNSRVKRAKEAVEKVEKRHAARKDESPESA